METLPGPVADVVRPLLPTLTDEIIDAVGREVPAYRRPLEGAFGQGVRQGVGVALSRFVEADAGPTRMYVDLGRGEYRQGRTLDALLAAYRVGARIAWRRITEAGERAGLEPGDLYRLGEALFSYIDALSAESAEGWASEQAAAAGRRQRRREELVRLLAEEPPADEQRVRDAAQEAAWRLPAQLAALAVVPGASDVRAGAGEEGARLAARIGPDVLAAAFGDVAVLLVPDPGAPALAPRLTEALGERAASLGPAVAPRDAGRSIALALRLLRLAADGAVAPAQGLLRVAEHLPALVLHADAELARELARRELAPLEAVSPAARAKLLETLRVWLDDQGRVEQTAHHLGVHPQTVRYRVNQLRELFGPRLEDPAGRHALALAVRAATSG